VNGFAKGTRNGKAKTRDLQAGFAGQAEDHEKAAGDADTATVNVSELR
jgi:hypothetical protein